jgi:hypothetical protein
MSAREIPLKSDFRHGAKANDVPVACLLDPRRKTLPTDGPRPFARTPRQGKSTRGAGRRSCCVYPPADGPLGERELHGIEIEMEKGEATFLGFCVRHGESDALKRDARVKASIAWMRDACADFHTMRSAPPQ